MPRPTSYTRTVTLREQALKLVQHRFDEGDISELDVARAKSELATARSDAMTVQRLRAASEHSLAVLLGKSPAQFSMAANPLNPVDIKIPAGPAVFIARASSGYCGGGARDGRGERAHRRGEGGVFSRRST